MLFFSVIALMAIGFALVQHIKILELQRELRGLRGIGVVELWIKGTFRGIVSSRERAERFVEDYSGMHAQGGETVGFLIRDVVVDDVDLSYDLKPLYGERQALPCDDQPGRTV